VPWLILYDSLNRETNVSGGGVVLETLAYAGPNRLAARQYANGTSSLFSYDGVVGTANAPGDPAGAKSATRAT